MLWSALRRWIVYRFDAIPYETMSGLGRNQVILKVLATVASRPSYMGDTVSNGDGPGRTPLIGHCYAMLCRSYSVPLEQCQPCV